MIDASPVKVDVLAYAGDDLVFTITAHYDDATPVDGSGVNLSQVRANRTDPAALGVITATGDALGVIVCSISGADLTAILDASPARSASRTATSEKFIGVWDLQVGDVTPRTVCQGSFTIERDVSRPVA